MNIFGTTLSAPHAVRIHESPFVLEQQLARCAVLGEYPVAISMTTSGRAKLKRAVALLSSIRTVSFVVSTCYSCILTAQNVSEDEPKGKHNAI